MTAGRPRTQFTRPTCRFCGGAGRLGKKRKDGSIGYRTLCETCHKQKWRRHRGGTCELCSFVPVHRCQLDVDHIDGNKKNNEIGNLQTLCANCHRLKSWVNGDYFKAKDL